MSNPVDPEQALRDLQNLKASIANMRQDLAVVGELSWAAFYLRYGDQREMRDLSAKNTQRS